jgi:hypothetical protein
MQRYLGCRARLRVVTHRCSHWAVGIILSFVAIPSRVATALRLEYRRCGELSFNPFQGSYCFETLTIAKKHPGFKAGFDPFQGSYYFETPGLRSTATSASLFQSPLILDSRVVEFEYGVH